MKFLTLLPKLLTWHNFKVFTGQIKVGYYVIKEDVRDHIVGTITGKTYHLWKRHMVCKRCLNKCSYFDQYDLYACSHCDLWLERFCRPEPDGKPCFPSPTTSPNGKILTRNSAPWNYK